MTMTRAHSYSSSFKRRILCDGFLSLVVCRFFFSLFVCAWLACTLVEISIAWHDFARRNYLIAATPKVTYASRSIYFVNYLSSLAIALRPLALLRRFSSFGAVFCGSTDEWRIMHTIRSVFCLLICAQSDLKLDAITIVKSNQTWRQVRIEQVFNLQSQWKMKCGPCSSPETAGLRWQTPAVTVVMRTRVGFGLHATWWWAHFSRNVKSRTISSVNGVARKCHDYWHATGDSFPCSARKPDCRPTFKVTQMVRKSKGVAHFYLNPIRTFDVARTLRFRWIQCGLFLMGVA